MIYTNTKAVMVKIRQIMLTKDIKIKDLAMKLCKSQSATSALLAQPNISLDTLNELCQALDCQLIIDIEPKNE